MQFEWDGKIGPASVLTVAAILINIVVFTWGGSAFVTRVTSKVDAQGERFEELKKDSDRRFQIVRDAIKETRSAQTQAVSDVTGVKTAISYISEQIKRVEQRLDGSVPAAPAIQPPKQ